jgi:hypothetical protein
MMILNEIHYNPATSTFFVCSLPRLEKSSFAKQALAYRINMEIHIYTPQAGESGILLYRKGNLTIAKSKSSRLSYSVFVSLPLESV